MDVTLGGLKPMHVTVKLTFQSFPLENKQLFSFKLIHYQYIIIIVLRQHDRQIDTVNVYFMCLY